MIRALVHSPGIPAPSAGASGGCSCSSPVEGRSPERVSSGTGARHSRSSGMPADSDTSRALLEIPSRHHITAQNPLGLLGTARLLFPLRAPTLRASAYHEIATVCPYGHVLKLILFYYSSPRLLIYDIASSCTDDGFNFVLSAGSFSMVLPPEAITGNITQDSVKTSLRGMLRATSS